MKSLRTVTCVLLLLTTPASAKSTWTQRDFAIGAWSPPTVEFTTDSVYAEIAAAGFTLVVGGRDSGAVFPDHSLKVLDLCRKHGLKYIARDPRIDCRTFTPEKTLDLDQVVAAYRRHPALYGYYVMDEPHPDVYPQVAAICEYLLEADPDHVPYVNLFPAYSGPRQIGFEGYREYVRDYVRTVRPPLLSFDHYSFLRRGERKDFFANLEIARRYASEAGIPLWVIVQSLQNADRHRPPTLEQMYWQVNASLAYGAKGIFYFPYWSLGDPARPEEWHYLGLRLPDGNPTGQYRICAEINPKLKALGPLLMTLTSVSVGHLGIVPLGVDAFRPDDLITNASGDEILVARFSGPEGTSYVMVMNRDWGGPGSVTLTLDAGRVMEAGRLGPGAPLSALKWDSPSRTLSMKLAPGEGRLIAVTGVPAP
jgi:hypothetical protein